MSPRKPTINAAKIGHVNFFKTSLSAALLDHALEKNSPGLQIDLSTRVLIQVPEPLKKYATYFEPPHTINLYQEVYQTLTSQLDSLAKSNPEVMTEFLRACRASLKSEPYPLSEALITTLSQTKIPLITPSRHNNNYHICDEIKLIAVAAYPYSYKIIMDNYGRPYLHLPSLKLDITVTKGIVYKKSSSLMPNQSTLSQLQASSLSSNTHTETSTHVSVNISRAQSSMPITHVQSFFPSTTNLDLRLLDTGKKQSTP